MSYRPKSELDVKHRKGKVANGYHGHQKHEKGHQGRNSFHGNLDHHGDTNGDTVDGHFRHVVVAEKGRQHRMSVTDIDIELPESKLYTDKVLSIYNIIIY